MRKILVLLVPFLILTTACGFRLRGSLPQAQLDAVSSIYVQSSRSGEVPREVRAQLEQAGVTLASGVDEAEYLLALANESMERNVLSVSAQTGKAEEYQLVMTIQMSVARNGETLVAGEEIRVARDYTFDEEAVLGKDSEERVLKEEMTRRAASQIIFRLNAVVRNAGQNGP